MNVVLIGAGGHALSTIDILEKKNTLVGLVDDNLIGMYEGYEILGNRKELKKIIEKYNVEGIFVAIGDNSIRKKIMQELEEKEKKLLINIIAETSYISPLAKIVGKGVYIGAEAHIGPAAKIEEGSIINTKAIVEHHNKIGKYVTIAPGAVLNGAVVVGDKAYVGANSTVLQEVIIGKDVIVGAGALVLNNCDKGTYIGVPAKKIK